jgi:hypothetical protein
MQLVQSVLIVISKFSIRSTPYALIDVLHLPSNARLKRNDSTKNVRTTKAISAINCIRNWPRIPSDFIGIKYPAQNFVI